MASSGAWCLIESDPGVFTELIHDFGVKGAEVEELWSLDGQALKNLRPVYGLVFLFKWTGRPTEDSSEPALEYPNVFFAQQVIPNACATQAIINILMNVPSLDLGPDLTEFREFVQSFSPDMKGLAISNSTKFREVHNSFAKPDTFLIDDDKLAGKAEDGFHFVAYVPVDGHVYELDGLKESPVDLGTAMADEWLDVAVRAIEGKIGKYGAGEIRFNLMAVIQDRRDILQAELDAVIAQRESNNAAQDTDVGDLEAHIADLQDRLLQEAQKRENYALENTRRKHNYIPFFINALQILARKNELMPLMQKAKADAKEKGGKH